MKDYISERALSLAHFIVDNKATVRCAAKHFGVSKSTVHKDIVERLPEINKGMAAEIKEILEENKAERHIRGGIATREKYKKLKSSDK